MRSMNGTRALVLASGIILLVAMAACRDLVQPGPAGGPVGEPFVQMRVIGLKLVLQDAVVTIDNSRHVVPEKAGRWESISELGDARFDGAEPGTYDVHIEPDYSSNTPAWDVLGQALEEYPVDLAYPGVQIEVDLDWPELAMLGANSLETWIRFTHRLPVPEGKWRFDSEHFAELDDQGRYRGVVPWEGTYRVAVGNSSDGFRLFYSYPDSMSVTADSVLVLESEIGQYSMSLSAHGAPYAGEDVVVDHYLTRSVWPDAPYGLRYSSDLTDQPASVYLLSPDQSEVEFFSSSGPAFLTRLVLLSADDMDPGAVNLGDLELCLSVTDQGGSPLPDAVVTLDPSLHSRVWPVDASGQLCIFLMPATYRIEVQKPGFVDDLRVVRVDGDMSLSLSLQSE